MEDDLKLQDFDQWVKIFILKHEGENLSKESKILGHPNIYISARKLRRLEGKCSIILCKKCSCFKRKHEGDNEDLRLSSQFQSMIDAISSSEDELEDDDYSLPDIDNYNFDYEFVE